MDIQDRQDDIHSRVDGNQPLRTDKHALGSQANHEVIHNEVLRTRCRQDLHDQRAVVVHPHVADEGIQNRVLVCDRVEHQGRVTGRECPVGVQLRVLVDHWIRAGTIPAFLFAIQQEGIRKGKIDGVAGHAVERPLSQLRLGVAVQVVDDCSTVFQLVLHRPT